MGADCSAGQAEAIVRSVHPSGRVWVFTDADEAGERCAGSTLSQVALHRPCRRVKGKGQPTDCTPGDLAGLLWAV